MTEKYFYTNIQSVLSNQGLKFDLGNVHTGVHVFTLKSFYTEAIIKYYRYGKRTDEIVILGNCYKKNLRLRQLIIQIIIFITSFAEQYSLDVFLPKKKQAKKKGNALIVIRCYK